MALSLRRVFSSHISEVGYDADRFLLAVVWAKGGVTLYSDVPADVGISTVNAPSVGSALHQHVRGKYPFVTFKSRDALAEMEGGLG